MDPTASISQIFSGIQGEGPRVGRKSLFLRFRGCNWNCRYCDTDRSRNGPAFIERSPGQRCFESSPNPWSSKEVAKVLRALNSVGPGHSDLAVTGGEPLLYDVFLKELFEVWPNTERSHLSLLLETNGTLPEGMEETGELWDVVSMDIKLESATGLTTPWELHRLFLEGMRRIQETIVKLVVVPETPQKELAQAADLILGSSLKDPQIVIQPAWGVLFPPGKLLEMLDLFLEKGWAARIIPQIHKILGDL